MTHKDPYIPPSMNMLNSIEYYLTSPQVQEFILSFNTTICFGMALIIFLLMRNNGSIITDETLDKIAQKTLPYFPKAILKLIPDPQIEHDIESQISTSK